MEKQTLRRAARGWTFGHVFFWMIYMVVVAFIVPRLYHGEGFEAWSKAAKTALALAPVIPVALWMLIYARFLGRTPDDLAASFAVRASALAGGVVLLLLFAQGWVELIAGAGVWPRFVFEHFDTTPWAYVAAYFLVWTIELSRLRAVAVR